MPSSPPIVFRVSGDDRVCYVNEQWDVFALQNDGADVTADAAGRS